MKPLTTREYQSFYEKQLSENRAYDRLSKRYYPYLVDFIKHHARKVEVPKKAMEKAKEEVDAFMQIFVAEMKYIDSRFNVKYFLCGSSYENSKIHAADEFDYCLELTSINADQLQFENTSTMTVHIKNNNKVFAQSYYKARFKCDMLAWQNAFGHCANCTSCNSCRHYQKVYFNANSVLDQFKLIIHRAASNLRGEVHADGTLYGACTDIQVEINGPAVSIHISNQNYRKPIKLDLTLCIPVHRTSSNQMWPLDGQTNITLNNYPIFESRPINTCHFVPSGDLWKLSFVYYEKELMREFMLDENKRDCLLVFKYLKEHTSVTKYNENPVLSNYVLKVAFLREATKDFNDNKSPNFERLQLGDEKWSNTSLPVHLNNMINQIDEEGTHSQLKSYFIENDLLLQEASNGHFEVRQIRRWMINFLMEYQTNVTRHRNNLLHILVACIAIFVVNIFRILGCPDPDPTELSFNRIRTYYIIMIFITVCRDLFIRMFCDEIKKTDMFSLYPCFISCYQLLLIMCSISYHAVVIGYLTLSEGQWDSGFLFSCALILESGVVILAYVVYYLIVTIRYGHLISPFRCCAEMISGHCEVASQKYLKLNNRLADIVSYLHYLRMAFELILICGFIDTVLASMRCYLVNDPDIYNPLLKRRP